MKLPLMLLCSLAICATLESCYTIETLTDQTTDEDGNSKRKMTKNPLRYLASPVTLALDAATSPLQLYGVATKDMTPEEQNRLNGALGAAAGAAISQSMQETERRNAAATPYTGQMPSTKPTYLDQLREAQAAENLRRAEESTARLDREQRAADERTRQKNEDLAYLAADELGAAYSVDGVIADVKFRGYNKLGTTDSTTTISPVSFTMTGKGLIIIDGTVSGYSRSGRLHTEKFEVMFWKDQETSKPTIVSGSDDFSRGISMCRITGYR